MTQEKETWYHKQKWGGKKKTDFDDQEIMILILAGKGAKISMCKTLKEIKMRTFWR